MSKHISLTLPDPIDATINTLLSAKIKEEGKYISRNDYLRLLLGLGIVDQISYYEKIGLIEMQVNDQKEKSE